MTAESAISLIEAESDAERVETFDATPLTYPDGKYDPLTRLLSVEWASATANLRVTGTLQYTDGGHGVADIPTGISYGPVGAY